MAGGMSGEMSWLRANRRPILRLGALVGGALVLAGLLLPGQAAQAAPAFRLTSQSGQAVGLDDLRGRQVMLTFLYSHCPDVCPLTLATTNAALNTLAAEGRPRPAVVVVTVDPDRDTVERLRSFAQTWPADWLFLTGSYQQLAPVWRAYGVTVEKRPLPHSSEVHHGYALLHTSKLVIVDEAGRLSGELSGAWSAAELAARLTTPDRPPVVWRSLAAVLDDVLRVCGEFAAAQPGLAAGVVAALLLPGLFLPVWLLRTLFGPRRAVAGRTARR